MVKRSTKREDRAKLGMGLFILIIMVFSVVGFAMLYQDPTGNTDYQGMKFIQNADQTWTARFEEQEYLFFFHPTDVLEYIPSESFDTPYVILTSDIYESEEDNQMISFAKYITQQQLEQNGVIVIPAFTSNFSSLPVFSCSNASSTAPVVYFTKENKTAVSYENNCYTLTADSTLSMMQVRDGLMYRYLLGE